MMTFRSSVRPVLTISQKFCAAPRPIRFLNPNSRYGRCRIIASTVLQLLLAGVLLVAGCLSVWYKRTHRNAGPQMAFFTYVLYHVDLLLGMFNVALVFVVCQWKRSSYEQFLEKLAWILELAKEARLGTGSDDCRWLLVQFNRLLMAFGSYIVVAVAIDWFYFRNPLLSIWDLGATFGPSVIQLLALLQYAYVLVFARRKCKAINEELRIMGREVLRSELGSYAERFPTLRKLHQQLHRLAFRVQGPFGLLVMMSIVSILATTCVTCLEVYQQTRGNEFDVQTGLYVAFGLLWVLFQVGRLLLILYPNHLMESERDLTGMLLQKLPNIEDADFNREVHTTNIPPSDGLSVFSRQIIHQKGPYRVCEIVDLDLELMAGLLGALTTYLVILIQFDSTPAN